LKQGSGYRRPATMWSSQEIWKTHHRLVAICRTNLLPAVKLNLSLHFNITHSFRIDEVPSTKLKQYINQSNFDACFRVVVVLIVFKQVYLYCYLLTMVFTSSIQLTFPISKTDRNAIWYTKLNTFLCRNPKRIISVFFK
jgi:hypothetical protein